MSVYISLFIRRCFNACVSLYSLVSLILLNRVAWLVLLFEFFFLSNGNGLGLSIRVKISTIQTSVNSRMNAIISISLLFKQLVSMMSIIIFCQQINHHYHPVTNTIYQTIK